MSTRHRALSIGIFAAVGLGAAAIIITIASDLSEEAAPMALRCAALSGAFIGIWMANRLQGRESKSVVRLGAIAGILVHPVMWFIYVNYRSIADGQSPGEYFAAWTNIFTYTLASVPQGAAITLPLFLAGTWIYSRSLPAQETSETETQSSDVS